MGMADRLKKLRDRIVISGMNVRRYLVVIIGTAVLIGCGATLGKSDRTDDAVPTGKMLTAEEIDVSERLPGEYELLILDYHQVLANEADMEKAIAAGEENCLSVGVFKEDIRWLSEEGYAFILPSDLKKAVQGLEELPEKAVMLTFDHGYESFYTVVWPQLRELGAKGAVGVIGSEADHYSGSIPKEVADAKLNWNQIRQMVRSDAVEIISMGYDLAIDAAEWMQTAERDAEKKGVFGKFSDLFSLLKPDISGKEPVIRQEDADLYKAALYDDLLTMDEKMRENLYLEAEALIYPKGFYSAEADVAAVKAGICMTMQEGVPAEDADGILNTIYGKETILGLKRILRPAEGSLKEYLKEYIS